MTLNMGLAQGPRLEDFFVGDNQALLAHLLLWLGPEGSTNVLRSPLPTYFWASSGSGKTHLLRGLQTRLQDQGETVGWIDAKDSKGLVFDPSWSAVLMDSVDMFDLRQQETAFQWFIDAQTQQKAVIAAGCLPPADLKLRDDLRSRLGWGHVFALQPLNDHDRLQVLQLSAHARGLRLSNEVANYLLARFSRDLGSLMHLLDKIDQYAMQLQRPITIPLIKSMMDNAQ